MRKRVFAEVAKMAYEQDYDRMNRLPYDILPGDLDRQRDTIFLERAIVGERIRLAMGLPLRSIAEHSLLSDGVEKSAVAEKYYDPPLINIIKYACNACPSTHYEVTNMCQGCLAHHCYHACPKDAISFQKGKAVIDQSKCIKCGKCKAALPSTRPPHPFPTRWIRPICTRSACSTRSTRTGIAWDATNETNKGNGHPFEGGCVCKKTQSKSR